MAVGSFLPTKVYFLPPDGTHQCNDKLKSRCFVQQYDRDGNELVYRKKNYNIKVGQFDEIVPFIKEKIFYHRCEAYPKFKSCCYCGEKGK
jgi:hypothetical protein